MNGSAIGEVCVRLVCIATLVALVATAPGCDVIAALQGGETLRCTSDQSCPPAMACLAGYCTTRAVDVDGSAPDAAAPDNRAPDVLRPDGAAPDRFARDGWAADRADAARADSTATADHRAHDGANDASTPPDSGPDAAIVGDAAVCQGLQSPCAPADWQPVLFNARSPASDPEPCPAGWTAFPGIASMYSGLWDPGCGPCVCSAPAGVTCTAHWNCFADVDCQTASACPGAVTTVPAEATCVDAVCDPICVSVNATVSGPSAGSCTAGGGQLLTPSWSRAHDLCVPEADIVGCVGSACLPAAGGSYFASACVAKLGFASCPQDLHVATTVYGSTIDSRICSSCMCGPPTGGACAADLELFSCHNCSTASMILTVPFDGTCVAAGNSFGCVGNPLAGSARYERVVDPGHCLASGGIMGGSLTADEPLTVCCAR